MGCHRGSILGPAPFLCLVRYLPSTISASNPFSDCMVDSVGYADDIVVWAVGKDKERVKKALEIAATAVADYALRHYLALNASKTQLLWAGTAGTTIKLGSTVVSPSKVVELLGVKFDGRLSPAPHADALLASARSIAGLARRLALHLPPCHQLLQEVVRSLLIGKLSYCCLVFAPMLLGTPPHSERLQQVQLAVNMAARYVAGHRRADKVNVDQLLSKAGLPTFNALITRSVALETWKAMKTESPYTTYFWPAPGAAGRVPGWGIDWPRQQGFVWILSCGTATHCGMLRPC